MIFYFWFNQFNQYPELYLLHIIGESTILLFVLLGFKQINNNDYFYNNKNNNYKNNTYKNNTEFDYIIYYKKILINRNIKIFKLKTESPIDLEYKNIFYDTS